MARIANCKSCGKNVLIPDGMTPEMQVRCPYCKVEFALVEVAATLREIAARAPAAAPASGNATAGAAAPAPGAEVPAADASSPAPLAAAPQESTTASPPVAALDPPPSAPAVAAGGAAPSAPVETFAQPMTLFAASQFTISTTTAPGNTPWGPIPADAAAPQAAAPVALEVLADGVGAAAGAPSASETSPGGTAAADDGEIVVGSLSLRPAAGAGAEGAALMDLWADAGVAPPVVEAAEGEAPPPPEHEEDHAAALDFSAKPLDAEGKPVRISYAAAAQQREAKASKNLAPRIIGMVIAGVLALALAAGIGAIFKGCGSSRSKSRPPAAVPAPRPAAPKGSPGRTTPPDPARAPDSATA